MISTKVCFTGWHSMDYFSLLLSLRLEHSEIPYVLD